jgi:hypothetical protein
VGGIANWREGMLKQESALHTWCLKTNEDRRKSKKAVTTKKATYWIQAVFSTSPTGGV